MIMSAILLQILLQFAEDIIFVFGILAIMPVSYLPLKALQPKPEQGMEAIRSMPYCRGPPAEGLRNTVA